MALVGAVGLALLLWAQRALDARAWPAWERLEDALERDVAALLRASLARRATLIGAFVTAVESEWNDGHPAEAVRLLAETRAQVDLHTQDTIESLREWADEARALLALLPIPPLAPSRLRLGRLRALAIAWRACHVIAVTSRERFLLRLLALRWSIAGLARWWRRVRLPQRQGRPWGAAPRTLKADLGALGTACADSYEALLLSRPLGAAGHALERMTREAQ